jgi:hypothetical protein
MQAKNNIIQIGTVKRIIDRFRYGLVLQVLRNKLVRLGIEFTPFYLTQLGINVQEKPQLKDRNIEFACGFLCEDDLTEMKDRARGYPTEKLLGNLRSGKKCYGIKHENKVAAFMWIDLEECNFKPLRFHLKKDEAYTFSVYTMEEYRGQNMAPVMAYHCYQELKMMGIKKIYSITEYFNRSAIKYKMKLGPRTLGLYLYIGLFKRFSRLFLLRKYS